MFSSLIESSPRASRPLAQSALSLALHLAVGVGVVEASRRLDGPVIRAPEVRPMVFVVPKAPPVAGRATGQAASIPDAPAAPLDPFLPEFPSVTPVGLPAVTPGPAVDPSRFVAAGGPSSCGSCPASPAGADAAGVFEEAVVDVPAEVIRQPAPAYPAALQAAGLGGRVVLQFVVDTAGRVEAATVRVVEANHPAFGASAAAAILEAQFRPARVGGRKVRQLVRQGVTFRVQ
jgi:protein TonB